MELYFGDLLPYASQFIEGLWISIYLATGAMLSGGSLGVLLYLGGASKWRLLSSASKTYVEVIRNTPLLLQLYLIYFALPELGINLNPLWAGFVALSLNNAAYTAEIYRAGFESLPKGLSEAATALGMPPRKTFRYVLLAPAMRNVLPSLTNQGILLFLASSITSIVAAPELMHVMMNISSNTFRTVEAFLVGGALYFIVAFVLAQASKLLETRVIKWKVA